MAGAEYYLPLKNTAGQQIAVIDDFLLLEYARTVNQPGIIHLSLPFDKYPSDYLPTDGIIEIWRKPPNFPIYLEGDTVWFIRKPKLTLTSGGIWGWDIYGEDALSLLKRRCHLVNPYVTKSGHADDVMKDFVFDNFLGRSSTSPLFNYNLTDYFNVQTKLGLAPNVDKIASWRNILTTLQELDQFSFTNGTYLAFDVVSTIPNTGIGLEFRIYTGQRGVDRRWGTAIDPVVLDPQAGTILQLERTWDSFDMGNLIIAGGVGTGASRIIAYSYDKTSINLSPFNLCEIFVDGTNCDTVAKAQAYADDQVRAHRARRTFSGQAADTDYMVYGGHYGFGDFLTCNVQGELIDVRLDTVATKVQSGNEQISILLRSDT